MKRLWSSFTFRLVIASLAWTLGLLYIAHLASVFMLFGSEAMSRFGGAMAPSTVLAIGIMVFGALVVRRALTTFTQLRERLLDVHRGRQRVVSGHYLNEVQPVVSTLNALLEHQDRRVRDALAKAGDLAHGLKTPLAVITHEAERAAASGHRELADTLMQQVDRMRRHIDYHLAHARAAASGATPGAKCSAAASAEGVARTLRRLHAQRGIDIEVAVSGDLDVRASREDLDEMLGNLLDNACKWARSRVVVHACADGGRIVFSIDDDGLGLAADMRELVLQRGVRADEAAPGSGFGLAIVRDLSALYGGSISLGTAPLGGLRARLDLPQAGGGGSAPVQVP